MRRVLLVAALAACGGGAQHPTTPTQPAAAVALDRDLGWLGGDWRVTGASGLQTHWRRVSTALYGLSLSDNGFAVSIIDPTDTPAHYQLEAVVGGSPTSLRLAGDATAAHAITFQIDGQAGSMRYSQEAPGLVFEMKMPDGNGNGFGYLSYQAEAAPELEAADRAFDAATAAHGADGWVAAFDEHGATWDDGKRVEGADAIRAGIAPLLAGGSLRWAPVFSRVRGDVGATIGTFTFTAKDHEAHGSYLTVWKRQADGGWKVLFDIGRADRNG